VRSKAEEMASLIYRTAQKRKIRKNWEKNRNRVAQKKRPGQIVRAGSPGGRSETTGVGFGKPVGF